jgi:hypothetical protein
MWRSTSFASRRNAASPRHILAEDEQWAKLRMIVELAAEVWG